jgi:hypothetical protein
MINTTPGNNNGESEPQESLRGPRELTANELRFSPKKQSSLTGVRTEANRETAV